MNQDKIIIQGARVHNLKNIDIEIPKNKLTVITGVSGSGKSSLAFDTIYAEGQRRYMESLSSYARQFMGLMEKPDVDYIEGLSPAIAIDQHTATISPRSTLGTMSEIYDYIRLLFTKIGKVNCPQCKMELKAQKINVDKKRNGKNSYRRVFSCDVCEINFPSIDMGFFSFNNPQGACPRCRGLGKCMEIEPDLVFPNTRLSIAEGAIRPWSRTTSQTSWYNKIVNELSKKYNFSLNTDIAHLPKNIRQIILFGDDTYEGVIPNLERRYRETDSDYLRSEIEKYMVERVCPACNGQRLRKEVLSVLIDKKNIIEINSLTIFDSIKFFSTLSERISKEDYTISEQLIREINRRLNFLTEVGLGYLSLDRGADSLSNGEIRRIRLATLLGSNLAGVIYILDEPSMGLHQRDQDKLLEILFKLRDLGNTVIVVEHDVSTMMVADYLIDLGPGAGELGGEIIASGTPKEVMLSADSSTGAYLSGKRAITYKKTKRTGNGKSIIIKGASEFNLKNIDVKIPLNTLTVVSGVSGSGKSTLVTDILARALKAKFYHSLAKPGRHNSILGVQNVDKVVVVDQCPIGKSPRSNPATYTNVFGVIRDIFSSLPEARLRKYSSGHFSFNVKGGRCEACGGDGVNKFEMYFLPDVYVTCPACNGKRYNQEVLDICYNGKNIADVLNMTIDEAFEFFKDIPILKHKLGVQKDVGLGYIRLGQYATTLSGGEAQRVKLATELARQETGKTLYILDEPTTGLHFEDIDRLLKVLQALVDKGNTVLVVEHNLDIIKCADWVIDMGPEGGEKGGQIVAEGNPEDIIKITKSYTGKYLKDYIK